MYELCQGKQRLKTETLLSKKTKQNTKTTQKKKSNKSLMQQSQGCEGRQADPQGLQVSQPNLADKLQASARPSLQKPRESVTEGQQLRLTSGLPCTHTPHNTKESLRQSVASQNSGIFKYGSGPAYTFCLLTQNNAEKA